MNILRYLVLIAVFILFSTSSLSAQVTNSQVIVPLRGTTKLGCLLLGGKKTKLVSLAIKTNGKTLSFKKERTKTKRALAQTNKAIKNLRIVIKKLKITKQRTPQIKSSLSKKNKKLKSLNAKKRSITLLLKDLTNCEKGRLKPPPKGTPTPTPTIPPARDCEEGKVPEGALCEDGDECTDDSRCIDRACKGSPKTTVEEKERCGVGACIRTVERCVTGVKQVCTPGIPTVEICNGIDDDCDSEIDEGCIGPPCLTQTDCNGETYCSAQRACVPKKVDGGACAASSDCVNSYCNSGVCCTPTGVEEGSSTRCCISNLDCAYLEISPLCTNKETCQGTGVRGVCDENFRCTAIAVEDDSACNAELSSDCGNYLPVRCTSAQSQIENQASLCPTSCVSSDECTTGHCVDGKCCDTACEGECYSCALPGLEGTCTPVPGGRPSRGGICEATGITTCDITNILVVGPRCDGLGSCRANFSKDCRPFRCSGEACTTSCQTSLDCSPASICINNACSTGVPRGGACTVGSECLESSNCVEGVCCNTPCRAAGTSCIVPGRIGTCSLIPPP